MRQLQAPLPVAADHTWRIQAGSNLREVNRQLHEQKLLAHPRVLSFYARLFDRTDIQVGSYRINKGDTALDLLDRFNRGEVILYQITFPEGWTFSQWLQKLAAEERFLPLPEKNKLLTAAGVSESHPEGWFFPDTYSYTESDGAADILRQAHQRMKIELEQAWQQRAENLPYNDPYQALIMASIVERETGVPEERPEIAGVFVRRLQKRMRLQTDPTVIYGLGEQFDGNLRRKHLRQATPYNTYVIKGLPPTPIAMPGRAALDAALNPAPGSSLYFVARGDGSHQFSDTLQQHQQAVQNYQINKRAKDYRSAPR